MWYNASIMRRFAILTALLALVSGCSTATYRQCVEPAGEVLSVHETVARFEGFEEVPCRHLTTACPTQCSHGGRYARFEIERYERYEKPGKYGDEQQASFAFRVALRDGSPDAQTPVALRQLVEVLKPGQKVSLTWKHLYVTDPATGSKWPERVVMFLQTE